MKTHSLSVTDTSVPIARSAPTGPAALAIQFGHASQSVPGKFNDDCYGVVTPAEEPAAARRGLAAAIADGVSGGQGGRLASETTVKTVLRDFYATPEEWEVSAAIDCVLGSVNDWLLVENSRHPELEGAVTSFSMLLFAGQRYCLVHVGDTRVYRRRGRSVEQLTCDHTWQRRDMRHVLRRAVGLDSHLVADYAEGDALPGDTYVLLSDGVWEVLGERFLKERLLAGGDPQQLAHDLTERSIRKQVQYMGRNDATALVAVLQEAAARR
jgi:protein phosphatase